MDVLRPVVIEHNSMCKQERHLSEDKENIGPVTSLVVKKKSSSMGSLHVSINIMDTYKHFKIFSGW